ncbi:hypothetical protein [Paenibacillus kobensis]|uniref:hypothetical protein n=1 Tax=Paenibacillus kobensis TaxID=59841 RepID=UPI000FD92805|nr:hypothetical protein [Paenibacillus kobensis]
MTYRSIDLQTSVARIPDKTITHSQSIHKPTADQLFVADQAAREQTRARTRNEKMEKSAESSIRDGGSNKRKDQGTQKRRHAADSANVTQTDHGPAGSHPYKGKQIDLSM